MRRTEIGTKVNCPARWDDMTGSDTVRHCGECRKNVYNLSAMSEDEANALLASADDACIRFYYRPDGTIVTSRCATASRSRAAFGLAAGFTAFASIAAMADQQPVEVDGQHLRLAMGLGMKLFNPPRKVGFEAAPLTSDLTDVPQPLVAMPEIEIETSHRASDPSTIVLTAIAAALALAGLYGLRWPRSAER